MLVEDDTGDVELVFFLANVEWIKKRLPVGATRWVSGKLELWDGRLQMVHPDRVMDAEELARMPAVEPVYGLTEGLYPRTVAKAAQGALARLPRLPEWIDDADLRRLERAGLRRRARARCTRPATPGDIDPAGPAATRLAYDELLANQLALLMVRARMRAVAGRAHVSAGRLAQRIVDALPFALTGAQAQALAEIRADLAAPKRMIRLLQGDVGSGKTIVALLAMADVVEAGRQAALMAPTEILARQHFERIAPARRGRRPAHRAADRPRQGVRAPPGAARRWRRAKSTSSSAPMRCSRRASPSAISASRWSTSSTASACTSASRSPARARRSICW